MSRSACRVPRIPQFMVWLAAKMVGRWPSGAPLVLAPDGRPARSAHATIFCMPRSDPNGLKCPFGVAHPADKPTRPDRPHAADGVAAHVVAPPAFCGAASPMAPRSSILRCCCTRQTSREALACHPGSAGRWAERAAYTSCVSTPASRASLSLSSRCGSTIPAFSGLLNNRDPIAGDNDPPWRRRRASCWCPAGRRPCARRRCRASSPCAAAHTCSCRA